MDQKHPSSPLQENRGAAFPSPASLEDRGRTWRKASDEYLIGFVMQSWGTDAANQTPAVVEMQRRLMDEIKGFNRSSTWLAGIVIFVAVMQLAVAGLQLWIAFKQH
jgi:hypothetical protein